MIAKRHLLKNMLCNDLAQVARGANACPPWSSLRLFVLLQKFLKVSCPLFEIRPLLTSKGKILTSLNQLNASGVS